MAKGRFKDRKVDTAVDAVNLAGRVGHWRHVTALSVSVKCADIPGRVGECPPPGPGHPGSRQKQSSQKQQDPEQEKAEISSYPQNSTLSVFWQSDYTQFTPGRKGRGLLGRLSSRASAGVSQHQEPSADSQRSLSGGGPTVGFSACLESLLSSYHTEAHR